MRPLDPRLLRAASAARNWVILSAVLQMAAAVALGVQSIVLAHAVAGVVGGADAATVLQPALLLALTFLIRGVLAGVGARFADRAATSVIRQLRAAVLDRVDGAGLQGHPPADVAILLTSELDKLEGYLVRYLPQLLATAVVTPMLLALAYSQDVISGVIMTVTLPLVPFFMALVGWTTQKLSEQRMVRMRRLGEQVLDLVAGLPTLRALGRALPQASRVRAAGEAYRSSTSKVLQVAFLSGFVLEFLTTLSVALVAVGIGMRLVFGELDLATGLAVLILAPEVYLPLRMVGQHFHASTDGIAAASAALSVLEPPPDNPDNPGIPTTAPRPALGVPRVREVVWSDVSVQHPGRDGSAPAALTARAVAGEVTALVGANGSGKSTAVAVLLGLRQPSTGRVELIGDAETMTTLGTARVDVARADRDAWWAQVAWIPQHPVLVPGTLLDNVELLTPDATSVELAEAAVRAGFADVIADSPAGWQRRLGAGGAGLSAGQRQRLVLTRALIQLRRGAGTLILDEPSAHLDTGTEQLVLRLVREVAAAGALVLVVAHRPALIAAADRVITVSSAHHPLSATVAP